MKPILFNTEMVRAFLAGQKTQTRRIVRPRHGGHLELHDDVGGVTRLCERDGTLCRGLKPPYEPGDILYVRETWTRASTWFGVDPSVGINDGYLYRADWDVEDHPIWNPSIHMPREAARLFLRVTDVRVERLWDMQPTDICAEGVCIGANDSADAAYKSFSELWNSTIKKADRDRFGWAANPWVWVYTFERIGKDGETWIG